MEYLDICTEEGLPTGKSISREAAHAQGILHRTAHIWLTRRCPEHPERTEILLQTRSSQKDSYPGCLDTSSAGHIPAGSEPGASALRELQEELGICISEAGLRPIGKIRVQYEKQFHGRLFRDNEVVFVYLCTVPVRLEDITIQESELAAVGWYDLEDTIREVLRGNPRYCVPTDSLLLVQEAVAASNHSCAHLSAACALILQAL